MEEILYYIVSTVIFILFGYLGIQMIKQFFSKNITPELYVSSFVYILLACLWLYAFYRNHSFILGSE